MTSDRDVTPMLPHVKVVFLRCVKAFIIAGAAIALLAHYVTQDPMPWWPDTFVFGAFMGAFAALVAVRATADRRAAGHLRDMWRAATGKRP